MKRNNSTTPNTTRIPSDKQNTPGGQVPRAMTLLFDIVFYKKSSNTLYIIVSVQDMDSLKEFTPLSVQGLKGR
jgi:hypothetical protein